MKKTKLLTMLLLTLLCSIFIIACGSSEVNQTDDNQDKTKVVCTIFPEYDWTREILGDLADQYDLTLLIENGTDMHSFQPSAADIAKISACDIFVYVGGESDTWVEDILKEAVNKDMQATNLMEVLGERVKEEEIVEGMQQEEEESEEECEAEYDEHVWLSLKCTQQFVQAITEALKKADAANAEMLQKNSEEYIVKLAALDVEYEETINAASQKTLLFGDRFPFRYMVDDYKLNYYAAFVGCSAETEASFNTIVFLAGKVDELQLKHVLVIENSDQKIAKTIIENTKDKNQDILVLDSLQSVTSDAIQKGETYLTVMQNNLEVLKTVLN